MGLVGKHHVAVSDDDFILDDIINQPATTSLKDRLSAANGRASHAHASTNPPGEGKPFSRERLISMTPSRAGSEPNPVPRDGRSGIETTEVNGDAIIIIDAIGPRVGVMTARLDGEATPATGERRHHGRDFGY
ncbi:hypothetical protein XA68_11378 [Ophiocordyceps unilateralis]|uniref:Uncharacterized protein n=1 Tax=Ophiocordyceps unilateralis TaxID=268505 RepID=A0A2A9NX75_OPHUN|nr:hypothetical protein XA68_11378 [Ophiocordyceps unilateralis]